MVKLSIIVPVYNVEKNICKCIESILAQTLSNFEVILVDDGSLDSSGIICDKYALKDSRVKVIHKNNSGVSSARNTGLEIAKGEYIGFVDSDDWIDKDMYETMLNDIERYNAQISICALYLEYENMTKKMYNKNQAIMLLTPKKAVKLMLMEKYMQGGLCNKLFNKKLFEKVKLDEQILVGEDLLCNVELMLKSKKIVYNPACKYHYFQRKNSVMNSKDIKKFYTMLGAYEKIELLVRSDMHSLSKWVNIAYLRFVIYLGIEIAKQERKADIIFIQKILKKNKQQILFSYNISCKEKIRFLELMCPFKYIKIIEKNFIAILRDIKNKMLE